MRPRRGWLLLPALLPAVACAQAFDPARSRVGFEVRSRLGTTVHGSFPEFDAAVDTLPDGRQQVRMRLATGSLRMAGPARHTRLARGPALFDSARHPWIEFVSDPYPAERTLRGGPLDGRLRIRGVEHRERFVLDPAACARPGHDCEVRAQGRVSRARYGLDGWRVALADGVRFRLGLRHAR